MKIDRVITLSYKAIALEIIGLMAKIFGIMSLLFPFISALMFFSYYLLASIGIDAQQYLSNTDLDLIVKRQFECVKRSGAAELSYSDAVLFQYVIIISTVINVLLYITAITQLKSVDRYKIKKVILDQKGELLSNRLFIYLIFCMIITIWPFICDITNVTSIYIIAKNNSSYYYCILSMSYSFGAYGLCMLALAFSWWIKVGCREEL